MALVVTARAVTLPLHLRLLGLASGDGTPAPRGPPPRPLGPHFLDRPGLAAPVASLLPAGDYTHGLLLVIGFAAVV